MAIMAGRKKGIGMAFLVIFHDGNFG